MYAVRRLKLLFHYPLLAVCPILPPCSGTVPALGPIAEQPGSGRSLGLSEGSRRGSQGGSQQQQQEQQAAAPEQSTADAAPSSTWQPQQSAASPIDHAGAPGAAITAAATAAAAAASESPGGSCTSSAASTPMAAPSGSRGLALPAGVPRIALQGMPMPKLQPQPDSNDWHQYAQTVSDASASIGCSSTQRQRGGTASPGSEATSPPPRSGGSHARRRTAPVPSSGGSGDLTDLAAAAAGSGRGSGNAFASAPATTRDVASAPLNPAGDRAGAAAGAAAGAGLHRLAQASGPDAVQLGAALPEQPPAAMFSPPSAGRGNGRGLARTASAPAGPVAAAAAAEERGRPQQAQQAQRMLSQVSGREGSAVDLTSPEAVAIQGRINSRLSRPVTERLVQVRGLVLREGLRLMG